MPSGSGNNERRKLATIEVAMTTADTEYFFEVPEGADNLEMKPADNTIDWRFSTIEGEIATPGNGHPMEGGDKLQPRDAYWSKTRIYFAHSELSAQTMKIAYMYPIGAR